MIRKHKNNGLHWYENFVVTRIGRKRMVRGIVFFILTLGALLPLSLTSQNAKAGYGECSKCNCQGYEGSTNQCQNCGHHYDAHW